MRQGWYENDRVINTVKTILERNSQVYGIEISSLVLYGSKARGDRNSQNDYEFLIIVDNDTSFEQYLKFITKVKLELIKEKLIRVNFSLFTPSVFEDVLYNDCFSGTFLYMICRENIILYDKNRIFEEIVTKIDKNCLKKEEIFLSQCIDFAKQMNSDKWAQKWEKTLMQYNYLRKRKEI